MSKNNLYDNYLAVILLGITGDKIGFDNGNREFYLLDKIPKYNSPNFKNTINEYSIYMLLEFISQGGIQSIDINNMIWSDDSIMMIANLEIICSSFKDYEDFIEKLKNKYLDVFENEHDMIHTYKAGIHTINTIRLIKSGIKWNTRNYEPNGGGSGGSMRSSPFGLLFHWKNDINKLIEFSIGSCAITHMNGIAFIGSFVNAYFTSMGINKIPIEKWIFNLLDILIITDDINPINIFIKNNFNHIYDKFLLDKQLYIDKINIYIEDNFNNYDYIYNKVRQINPVIRILYYFDNFTTYKNNFFPGSASDDSILFSYDCLLMAKDNYEKLIYYSMIHLGDSDTTGIISSNWYGSIYGFSNVYKNLYKHNNISKINKLIKNLLNI